MPDIKKFMDKSLSAVQSGAKSFNETVAPKIGKAVNDATESAGKAIADGSDKIASVGKNAKDTVMNQLDVNHDGNVDIVDIITLGLKTPGIKVNREQFLKKELTIHYDEETVILIKLQMQLFSMKDILFRESLQRLVHLVEQQW